MRKSRFRYSLSIFGSSSPSAHAFTMIELIVVIGIILVLGGLILATSTYVHNKGARSRAEAEIAAISAALENYTADNGVYPGSTLDPAQTDPTTYQSACKLLYASLIGDTDQNGQPGPGASYMTFKPNQVEGFDTMEGFIKDPFGNSYGYSTIHQTDPNKGYNPTFDLWSTANSPSQTQWIKNW